MQPSKKSDYEYLYELAKQIQHSMLTYPVYSSHAIMNDIFDCLFGQRHRHDLKRALEPYLENHKSDVLAGRTVSIRQLVNTWWRYESIEAEKYSVSDLNQAHARIPGFIKKYADNFINSVFDTAKQNAAIAENARSLADGNLSRITIFDAVKDFLTAMNGIDNTMKSNVLGAGYHPIESYYITLPFAKALRHTITDETELLTAASLVHESARLDFIQETKAYMKTQALQKSTSAVARLFTPTVNAANDSHAAKGARHRNK